MKKENTLVNTEKKIVTKCVKQTVKHEILQVINASAFLTFLSFSFRYLIKLDIDTGLTNPIIELTPISD